MAASPDLPQAPPSKKSIFNKPAWARAAPALNEPDAEDSTDFFRRSDRTFAAITAEQEVRRKKRKAKKGQHDITQPSSKEEGSKRRRTTSSANEDEPFDIVTCSETREESKANASKDLRSSARSPARSSNPPSSHGSPKPRSLRLEQKTNSIAVAKAELERMMSSNVISLDSDEEAGRDPQKPSKPDAVTMSSKQPKIDEFEISDDEELFPELAQKARDDAKQKRLQQAVPKVPSSTSASNDIANLPMIIDTTNPQPAARKDESAFSSARSRPPPPPPPPDPIISIFVQSDIPDTIPFILNRKLNQRLKEVRQYWCKRQNFPPGFADSVILTWRGRRVFDVTSCAALGLVINDAGKVAIKGEGNIFSDDEDDGGAQIHMEAMTEGMFEERQKRKSASRQVEEDVDEEEGLGEEVETEKEAQTRIILKSKEFKEFYLLVKPVSALCDFVLTFRSLLSSCSNAPIVHSNISYYPSLSFREQGCR